MSSLNFSIGASGSSEQLLEDLGGGVARGQLWGGAIDSLGNRLVEAVALRLLCSASA